MSAAVIMPTSSSMADTDTAATNLVYNPSSTSLLLRKPYQDSVLNSSSIGLMSALHSNTMIDERYVLLSIVNRSHLRHVTSDEEPKHAFIDSKELQQQRTLMKNKKNSQSFLKVLMISLCVLIYGLFVCAISYAIRGGFFESITLFETTWIIGTLLGILSLPSSLHILWFSKQSVSTLDISTQTLDLDVLRAPRQEVASGSTPTVVMPTTGNDVDEENQGIFIGPKVECGCRDHTAMVLVDTIIPCSVTVLSTLLFNNEKQSSFVRTIARFQKRTNCVYSDWSMGAGDRDHSTSQYRGRTLTYRLPLKGPIGPPETEVTERQRYKRDDAITHGIVVVETETDVHDAPYGDCFTTYIRYCLTHNGTELTRLLITCDVIFFKRTMMSRFIVNAANNALVETFGGFLEQLNQVLKEE